MSSKVAEFGYYDKKKRVKSDYYATDPRALDYLLKYEKFDNKVWECACGGGNLSKKLEEYGYDVKSTDLYNHGYGESNIDFLKQEEPFDGDIITNPPYSYSLEFVLKALELSKRKVAMLFNIRFLESIRRYENLFKVFPPSTVYVFVRRIHCYPDGEEVKKGGSSVCYCWFVFDKEYDGEPIIRWINNKR